MNALEAYEDMKRAKELWLKNEPYTEKELKEVKQYLYKLYSLVEGTLRSTNIDLSKKD